jgi:hypothetical protein
MMENGVQTLNAWHRDIGFLSKFQWRSEIRLNFHGALSFEVQPHGAVVFLRLCHLLKSCFPEVGGKCAFLCFGKREQLIQHASDQSADADLLDQFGMVWCFKQYTGRVEGNRTAVH